MFSTNACDLAWQNKRMSKFEQYGKHLIFDLKAMHSQSQDAELPFHRHQIKAVLKTKDLVMMDDTSTMTETTTESIPKPIIIVAPTGAGKSGIIVMLPYVLESSKVLVLTPSKVISEQLRVEFGPSTDGKCFLEKTRYETDQAKLENFLETVTMIEKAKDVIQPECLSNLVIVNAQKFGGTSKTSLVYNKKTIIENVRAFFARFDTLIVDEAHHYPAKTWTTIVDEFGKHGSGIGKRIIFLTAISPYRTNADGDKEYIGNSIDGGRTRIPMEILPQEVEGITTRICKFKESEKLMTFFQLACDLKNILEDHHQKENRFVPQAMILVRTQEEANKTAKELNQIYNNEPVAVAILGSERGSTKRSSSGNELNPLKKFTAGEYRVAVTCGMALKRYDNSRVTLCVILRKIVTGRILFAQFVGRCKRMQCGLDGDELDRTVATVFSYRQFGQRAMWDKMDRLAESDPVEIDDDDVDESEDDIEDDIEETTQKLSHVNLG